MSERLTLGVRLNFEDAFIPSKKTLSSLVVILVAITGFLTAAVPVFAASKEKVLHSFGYPPHGNRPLTGLIFDAAGNLYGTTTGGGAHDSGTVFQFVPAAGGTWTYNLLYSFCVTSGCTDGTEPETSLIFDAAGNLYGATAGGGAYDGGTVFQLAPSRGGALAETVLYNFCSVRGCRDGDYPASLIFDSSGNLYGTTVEGGASGQNCGGYGCCTVFKLTPRANGEWKKKVIHSFFNCPNSDGGNPDSSLIFDSSGNLYGTTMGYIYGCGHGFGTVFEITP